MLYYREESSMTVRRRCLPAGWYPADPADAAEAITDFERRAVDSGQTVGTGGCAALAPHASWFYSGYLAYLAIASLESEAETVVVFGGHQGPFSRPLLAEEDAFETPFGPMPADEELRDALRAEFGFDSDRYSDNTVELQLPLLRRRYPGARVLWIRTPASELSFQIGQRAAQLSKTLGRRTVALGSADLTHYGPNYDFAPHGLGSRAAEWVRETNDRRFIEAAVSGSWKEALSAALSDSSSCSPGAAAACIGFAQARGVGIGRLLAYAQSADLQPSSSFVGYAAISWA